MYKVDLNSDLGESFGLYKIGSDEEIIRTVTSVNIACGIHAGVDTAVVFTGEAKREDLKNTKYPPSYTFENIKELYETIQKERVQ